VQDFYLAVIVERKTSIDPEHIKNSSKPKPNHWRFSYGSKGNQSHIVSDAPGDALAYSVHCNIFIPKPMAICLPELTPG